MPYDLPCPARDRLHVVADLHGPLARPDIQALLTEPHRAIPGDVVAIRQSGLMIDGHFHGTLEIVRLGPQGPVTCRVAELPRALRSAAKLCIGAVQDDHEIHEVIRAERPELYAPLSRGRRIDLYRFRGALGVVSYPEASPRPVPEDKTEHALFVESPRRCEATKGGGAPNPDSDTGLKQADRLELLALWDLLRGPLS